MRIFLVETDADIDACYPVMVELRSHIARADFVPQVRRQHVESGYGLVALADPEIVAVAGIRVAEWLPSGRCLEIEDLVTKEGVRSQGHGAALFDWIVDHARQERCNELKLVSHVTRFAAHRFYLNRGMSILAHFFSMKLTSSPSET